MRLGRALTIAFALAVCAWFVLGARQARETAQATSILTQPDALSASQSARAASLLRSAGTLNPDSTVDLLRARLAIRQHELARAKRIVEGVTRREPKNIEAWYTLAEVSGNDPSTFVLALKRVNELERNRPSGHGRF